MGQKVGDVFGGGGGGGRDFGEIEDEVGKRLTEWKSTSIFLQFPKVHKT